MPESMRAVAVRVGEAGSAQLIEVPVPEAAQGEVLVRVLEVAVDETDREINAAAYGEAPAGEERLILGHEALGRVEGVGGDHTGLSVGDLVVPTVRRPCPQRCQACRIEQSDFCSTGHYTERGIRGAHGYLAEYFAERPQYLVAVPLERRDLAVLVEPTSIVVKAFEQVLGTGERLPFQWEPRRALVLGAGPIGLLATYLLRLRGLEVFTAARTRAPTFQAELAEASGAHYLSTEDHPVDTLGDVLGGLDVIVEASGSSEVAFEALGILGVNGVLCLMSVSGGGRKVEIPTDALNLGMVLGNKLALGTVSSNAAHFHEALRSFDACERQWPGLLRRLLTRRVGLSDFGVYLAEEPGVKTVVEVAE